MQPRTSKQPLEGERPPEAAPPFRIKQLLERITQWELFEKWSLPLIASLVVHLALLLWMAVIVVSASRSKKEIVVVASLGGSDAAMGELVSIFELTADPEPASTLDFAPNETQFSEQSVPLFDLGVEVSKLDTLLESKTLSSSFSSRNHSSVIGNGGLKAQGTGSGNGSGGASFFGSYASGNRFVFVLDSSASMQGDRWDMARARLIACLKELGPSGQFFVICFDMQTSLMFDSHPSRAKFRSADHDTITSVERWLRRRTLGMATMPAEALGIALQLQPDAIFLLSDGELHDQSRALLKVWNQSQGNFRRVPIHTIHLMSEEGRETLQHIAKENDGTFTFVYDRLAIPNNLGVQ